MNLQTQKPELLPCPGGAEHEVHQSTQHAPGGRVTSGWVICSNCGFQAPYDVWNRRTPATEPAAAACDTCKGNGRICIGTSGQDSDGNALEFEKCPECGYSEPAVAGEAGPWGWALHFGEASYGITNEKITADRFEKSGVKITPLYLHPLAAQPLPTGGVDEEWTDSQWCVNQIIIALESECIEVPDKAREWLTAQARSRLSRDKGGNFNRIAGEICLAVCELPDRTSPDDWPEALLVTYDELHAIILSALASEATQ